MEHEENVTPAPQPEPPSAHHIQMIKALNKRIMLITVSLCILLVLFVAGYSALHRYRNRITDDGLILDNVIVGGVNIGGMTPEDAENVIRLTIESVITAQDMVIRLDYDALVLSPVQIGMQMNVEALVQDAYSYGRNGTPAQNAATRVKALTVDHHIALVPYLSMDLNAIYDQIRDFCAGYRNNLTQPSVTLEGQRPTYGSNVDSHQKLIITMGTPQSNLTADDLYAQVLDGYSLFQLELYYDPPVVVEPQIPDAQAIFDAYCIAAQDATIDSKTFAVTPEVYGYGFNTAIVQRRIDRADYGEQIEVTLEFIMPDITAQALAGDLFKDTLASYVSKCPDPNNTNRNKNLKLACQTIDGLVLKAGETFDFNQLFGQLSTVHGYTSAPTYSNSSTNTVGGGISQVASALHYCALLSELRIDERHPHRYAVEYTPLGTDAAINYGSENLVFTNNTSAPIRILASVSGSTVTITMLGTKPHSYTTQISHEALQVFDPHTTYQTMVPDNVYGYKDGDVSQPGLTGYELQLFRCYYDASGNLLRREQLGDPITYSSREEVVVRIHNNDSPDDEIPPDSEMGV